MLQDLETFLFKAIRLIIMFCLKNNFMTENNDQVVLLFLFYLFVILVLFSSWLHYLIFRMNVCICVCNV